MSIFPDPGERTAGRRSRLRSLILGWTVITVATFAGVRATVASELASTKTASPPASTAVAPSTSGGAGDLGYLTADQLVHRCRQTDSASSSYCFAYIAAVTDTARAYEIWLNAKEFCLPANISQSETRRAFITYLNVYPAQASGQAASVVVNALKQTYPCV